MTNEISGRDRTAKARATAMRNAENRKAEHLTERGWITFPPDVSPEVRELIRYAADLHHSQNSDAPRSR